MMPGVMIYQRATGRFDVDPSARGHHVVYRVNETNRCPGCGRAQWYVGRQTAECGFCGTAVALAEAAIREPGPAGWFRDPAERFGSGAAEEGKSRGSSGAERRRNERLDAAGRTLQLLIDGSPHSFALENISAGGVKGEGPAGLTPMTTVHVRFEGGILVPAVVRWVEGGLVGLAFTAPILLDTGSD